MGTPSNCTRDDDAWPEARWARILDRMEYRQPNVGLRFWGPPLWLEVTFSGADSERWSTAPAEDSDPQSWDWQSVEPCVEVTDLLRAEADDDTLLEAAGRYTIENLVLNAVHEIGEWLRFDARRCFPAHTATSDGADAMERGSQGNGEVRVAVDFSPPVDPPVDDLAGVATERDSRRIVEAAAPWRFTYLPGTRISYDRSGPAFHDERVGCSRPASQPQAWSARTLAAVEGPPETLIAAVIEDVHRMLVVSEADRACQAFYMDGRQAWTLAGGHTSATQTMAGLAICEPRQLSVSISMLAGSPT